MHGMCDIFQPAEHSRRCFRDLLTLLGVPGRRLFSPDGHDRGGFVGAHIDPDAVRLRPVIQAFVVGSRRRNDFLESSVKS